MGECRTTGSSASRPLVEAPRRAPLVLRLPKEGILLRNWLREPLAHFLALGGGLFLLFALVRGGGPPDDSSRIEVSSSQVASLADAFTRTRQRQPTASELAELVEEHVREEIYVREALAMELHRDDAVVRARLRQQMEAATGDLVAGIDPDEDELRAYLAAHPDRFRVAARVSFEHVFFDPERRGDEAARRQAGEELARLRAANGDPDPDALGDRLPLPRRYADAPLDGVGSRFGAEFAEALLRVPLGEWSGPLASTHGLHLVRVRERQAGTPATLAQARDRVERQWRAERLAAAREAFERELRQRYDVVMEKP